MTFYYLAHEYNDPIVTDWDGNTVLFTTVEAAIRYAMEEMGIDKAAAEAMVVTAKVHD